VAAARASAPASTRSTAKNQKVVGGTARAVELPRASRTFGGCSRCATAGRRPIGDGPIGTIDTRLCSAA
jgi:hypothetical protein